MQRRFQVDPVSKSDDYAFSGIGTSKPFNVTDTTMQAVNRYLLDHGVSTMIRWHNVMTNPPLCVTEEQLAEAFDVVDGALDIADAAMEA